MARRVTITDVAEAAGVSTMTVSRVVNGTGRVSEATRLKVNKVIRQLGYEPNRVARGLTTRQSQTVGIVLPDITNPFFPAVIRGAEDAAWDAGYTVALANVVEDPARERAAITNFEAHRVDGIIVCGSRLPSNELDELLARHSHSVLVNRHSRSGDSISLMVDDLYGYGLAMKHLIAGGHTRIGLLAGPNRSSSAAARRTGYRNSLESAGIPYDSALTEECEPVEKDGYRGLKRLLRRQPDITAVISYNDIMAIGALQAATESGLRVPQDLAVVGCDDVRIASLVTPSLTTLRIRTYELGQLAFNLLLKSIKAMHVDDVTLKPELMIRNSAP